MIVKKFISGNRFLPAFLVVWSLFLWADAFLFYKEVSFSVTEKPAPLYELVILIFRNLAFINVMTAFVFVVVQAFMVNNLLTSKNLVERNSYLPALLYVTLMSFSFNMFGLNPVIFANFFIIIALDKIFDVYNEEEVFLEVFNVGLLIGIATLFYLPSFVFYLLLLVALAVYYLINIRGFLSSLLGFLTPAFFIGVYYYMSDQFDNRLEMFIENIQVFQVFSYKFSNYVLIFMAFLFLVSLFAFVKTYATYVNGKPVRIRKRFTVIAYFVLFSLLSYLFVFDFPVEHFAIMTIGLSPVIAVLFQEIRRKSIKEIIFSLIVILIIMGKLNYLGYLHFF